MIKYWLTVVMLCFSCLFVNAQSIIRGRVYEDNTRIALQDIQVRDVTNKQMVLTDKEGKYAIRAKVGDLLVFSSFAYETDTVVVTSLHDKEVLLIPKGHVLQGVDVNTNAAEVPNFINPYAPKQLAPGVKYQTDKDGNAKGGVAFDISLFGDKAQKQKALEAKQLANDKVRAKIDAAFNAKTLIQYVPLRGKELDDFISLYRPDVDVYSDKNFNLATYVNNSYKEFMKLPPEKRHLVKLKN